MSHITLSALISSALMTKIFRIFTIFVTGDENKGRRNKGRNLKIPKMLSKEIWICNRTDKHTHTHTLHTHFQNIGVDIKS